LLRLDSCESAQQRCFTSILLELMTANRSAGPRRDRRPARTPQPPPGAQETPHRRQAARAPRSVRASGAPAAAHYLADLPEDDADRYPVHETDEHRPAEKVREESEAQEPGDDTRQPGQCRERHGEAGVERRDHLRPGAPRWPPPSRRSRRRGSRSVVATCRRRRRRPSADIAAYRPTTGGNPANCAYAIATGKATAATERPAATSAFNHSRR
jgi:hypothetical protein